MHMGSCESWPLKSRKEIPLQLGSFSATQQNGRDLVLMTPIRPRAHLQHTPRPPHSRVHWLSLLSRFIEYIDFTGITCNSSEGASLLLTYMVLKTSPGSNAALGSRLAFFEDAQDKVRLMVAIFAPQATLIPYSALSIRSSKTCYLVVLHYPQELTILGGE